MNTGAPPFRFEAAVAGDFDALLALRIATMRPSLERIGRYDPARAADRSRATFRPPYTRHIVVVHEERHEKPNEEPNDERAGCVGCWPEADEPGAMRIEHFYIAPRWQGRGLGAAVLARLFAETPAATCFRVGALRASDANRFYRRHGFVERSASAFDIEYERRSGGA